MSDLPTLHWRNARWLPSGQIFCELEHPKYGWIPFAADKNDPELHGRLLYAEIVDSGDIAPVQDEEGA
jgi:hypothetical protein